MSSSAATVDKKVPAGSNSEREFAATIKGGRLAHAILAHGTHFPAVEAACLKLAGMLLNTPDALRHPDFFALRPSGKARFIRVDPMREFMLKLQLTGSMGTNKVGFVFEADRMMPHAANAFLKTLEEPPAGTTLFLLTTRPHDLSATIRSRCLRMRITSETESVPSEDWQSWRTDYAAWLQSLASRDDGAESSKAAPGKDAVRGLVLTAYGLGARFEHILSGMTDTAWEEAKARLPEGLDDDEIAAWQTGTHKGIRTRLLGEIERATRDFAIGDISGPRAASRATRLSRAVADLEKVAGLLEVNLAEAAAIEFFLLRSMRHWTARE